MKQPAPDRTPPTMRVRRAQADEYAGIGELTLSAYAADGLVGPSDGTDDHYSPQLRDAARRDAEAEVWVAVDETDAVAGTVTWCPPDSPWREVAEQPDQAEFRMLAVDPAVRGRGVGRVLVDWCVRRARAEGMREIVLSSLPAMTAAHRIYRAYGFDRAPELDHRPLPAVELWAFRLELAPGSPSG